MSLGLMMAPTEQGFTGHRQMDALGVVHMKGRIYDPTIGRFLQADPFIQAPKNSQNYNRYSYVLNNPMSYTDPSGYFFKAVFNFIKKNWRTIVSIVASYVTFGLTTAAWGFAEIANLGAGMLIGGGAASGFVGGLVSTGSLRGALQGALSGALFGAIGGAGLEGWSAFGVSGIAGGMLSELQGGQFGHGFISAGIGAVSGGLFGKAPITRVVGSAIIGGTISELTGGKFANGAMTAAFAAALRARDDNGQSFGSGEPTKDLRDHVIKNNKANLSVSDDGKMISGTVNYYCSVSSGCSSMVGQLLEYFNGQYNDLTVNIELVEVSNIFRADIRFTEAYQGHDYARLEPGKILPWDTVIFNTRYPQQAYNPELWAHEFAHFIGFGHKLSTHQYAPHSVTSYSFGKIQPLSYSEVMRLISAYK